MKTINLIATGATLLATCMAAETIWLVNSSRGSEISSGFAYYSNYVKPGARPQDYIDVVHGTYQHWEGALSGATFNSGVHFQVDIPGDGKGPAGSQVGDGYASNASFNKHYVCSIPANQNQQIYTVDGYSVRGIYICQAH